MQYNSILQSPRANINQKNPKYSQNTYWMDLNSNLSSRSIKFNMNENGNKQKERDLQMEEKGSFILLPLVDQRPTYKYQNQQYSLSKSRKIDLNGANSPKKKYQYGDEGVKVREGVVEKYKASNYQIQRQMLQKFQKDAEQYRRNRNLRFKKDNNNTQNLRQIPKPSKIFIQNQHISSQNISFLQLQHQEKIKKGQYQKQLDRRNKVIQNLREEEELLLKQRLRRDNKQKRRKIKNQFYIKRQKQNMIQVGNMLRQIDYKIKQNSQQLHDNIRNLRQQLLPNRPPPVKVIKIVNNKFSEPIDQRDFQSVADQLLQSGNHTKSCKLPVVLYNNKYYDAKSYFAESSNVPNRVNRASVQSSSQNLKNIIGILRKNQKRLKLLTEQSQSNSFSGQGANF